MPSSPWPPRKAGISGTLVSLDEVREAERRIRADVLRTPLIPDPHLSGALDAEVRLKCESLQRTGSFKARGACNFLAKLTPEELEHGVITYSSGNHAQAVALAAGLRRTSAVVVMPTTAPKVKVEGAERLGARVELAGTTSEHRRERAEEIAGSEGRVMVPPFDHRWIIAGAATVAHEVFEEWPDVETLVVPIGGGGLASGCAAALRRLKPESRVVGVEPYGAPAMRRALEDGRPLTLEVEGAPDTIADGLAPIRVGDLTHAHAEALLAGVELVGDDEIRRASVHLLERAKLVVEFSGAAAVAALLAGRVGTSGRKICAVLSGGNMDPALLAGLVGWQG